MKNNFKIILAFVLISIFSFNCFALKLAPPNNTFENDAVKVSFQLQHDKLAVGSNSALAVHFEMGDGWHFYADSKSAPAPNLHLQITPKLEGFDFGEPIFPTAEKYADKTQDGKVINVFSHKFTVYIPFVYSEQWPKYTDFGMNPHIAVSIDGAYCSDKQCRIFSEEFTVASPVKTDTKSEAKFEIPKITEITDDKSTTSIEDGFAGIVLTKLGLAFIVGLLFNVMPCVLPVIPLIITKLLNQSKESKSKSLALGFTFCIGIISFFAVLAILNIVLRVGFGTVFQWGDYFRYPWFIKAMGLLLILLGLFMFGLFTIGIPSSVTNKAGSGEGFAGAIGMGFLAALLSTPCSFGILAGVFAWAQTQNLIISTAVFLLMGIGMAAPYAILILIPGLLKSIPKPGDWMEHIKQAMGFVMLIIAVKLMEALAIDQLISTLYFAVFLSIAVWMWGSWVNFTTPKKKKYITRLVAVILALAAGFYFLPAKQGVINWNKYDTTAIEKAKDSGQAVLIKFDAFWCASCKVVEKRIYKDKNIADMINSKDMLIIKGDTTTTDLPATDALKNIYNEPGIPVTVIHLPGQDEPIKLRGMISKNDLIEVLKKVKDKPTDG